MNSQVKIRKAKFGRFLVQELFVGLHHSRTRWICLWTWKFFTLCYLDFYGLHQCRYWLSLQALSSSWKTHGETEDLQVLIVAVFLITTSIQEPTRSYLLSRKVIPIIQEILKDLSLMSDAPILRKLQRW